MITRPRRRTWKPTKPTYEFLMRSSRWAFHGVIERGWERVVCPHNHRDEQMAMKCARKEAMERNR